MSKRASGRLGKRPYVLAAAGLLVPVTVIGWSGPQNTMLVLGPLAAGLLLLLARRAGLTADDVGLARHSWGRGAAYAAVSVAAVAAVYVVAVLRPGTREAFLDQRYQTTVGEALFTALVAIPLGTILLEEVAFRGVLWGLVNSDRGATRATLVSSVLFGLWHVLSSLRLNRTNPAVTELVGTGRVGQMLAVGGAVVFTGLAGAALCELRRRSGSLLAPAGLHWAANGLGVLISAGLRR